MKINKFQHYLEMAQPRSIDIKKVYYHGTPHVDFAKNIIQNGINPPDVSLRAGNKFQPVSGKVYITPRLSYALIYALGGHMLGNECDFLIKQYGNFGYLFVISGKDIKDIEPDEDSIGEIASQIINNKLYDDEYNYLAVDGAKGLKWLKEMAYDVLSGIYPEDLGYESDEDAYGLDMYQLLKEYHDYADLAASGKELLKHMTDEQKLQLIDCGAHVAHTGSIKPIECWELDRRKSKELKPDGSNFFKISKKIDL